MKVKAQSFPLFQGEGSPPAGGSAVTRIARGNELLGGWPVPDAEGSRTLRGPSPAVPAWEKGACTGAGRVPDALGMPLPDESECHFP